MRRFAPIIVPVLIWAASIIPAIAPGMFDISRMADIVVLGALGWLFLPMQIIFALFLQTSLTLQIIALLLLLLPIGPLLIRPILNRHGFDWLSATYSLFIFLYLCLGFYLASERINGMAINNIYGYKYFGNRYDSYVPFETLSKESLSDTLHFTIITNGPSTEYEFHIPNGGFIIVDDDEQNMDWALRKMVQIPDTGYTTSIKWHGVLSRRVNRVYFFCKIGDKYGKGVIYGYNVAQTHIFIPADNSMIFATAKNDPDLADWMKWFVSKGQVIYMN